MHAEKNKGADQSAQLHSSLNQTTGFTVYLYNASYIKICKNSPAFAVDFQCLRSKCGSVVFWVVAILIWPSLLCPAR